MRYLNQSKEKINGVVYTPRELANYVVQHMLEYHGVDEANIKILDPAIGSGELIEAFLDAVNYKKMNITVYGYETDSKVFAKTLEKLQLKYNNITFYIYNQDFIQSYLDGETDRYDYIIANPPYIRTQILGAEKAQMLAKQFGLTGRIDICIPTARRKWNACIGESAAETSQDCIKSSNRKVINLPATYRQPFLRYEHHGLGEDFFIYSTRFIASLYFYGILINRLKLIEVNAVTKNKLSIFFAILAAALYAINIPLAKLLGECGAVPPTMLAALLYLGAGVGVGIVLSAKKIRKPKLDERWLTKKDLPYTVAMVVLDIAAPIFLMLGIANTGSANVSLLNNFEIVATSVIALVIFKEKISKRLWGAILLVVLASVLLGFEGAEAFCFGKGSIFVVLACICWGIENNCTRSISDKSSEQIVIVKGLCSGTGSLIIAFILGESLPHPLYIAAVMLLGFVAYGLSINFYIMAQKHLGAAKTSAFYSIAPFLGVGFSFIILGEKPALQFYIALVIMIVSTLIMVKETLVYKPVAKS